MNLTDHFTLEELTFSSTAQRLGITNQPDLSTVAHLTILAMGLEQVRALLGHPMHIDCAYRCEALEKVLTEKDFAAWCIRHGRNPQSAWPEYFATKAHPQGFAADYVCPGFGTPAQIVKAIEASGLRFDQCIQEGTWVHISFAPTMRGQLLTANFGPNGTTYTNGVA